MVVSHLLGKAFYVIPVCDMEITVSLYALLLSQPMLLRFHIKHFQISMCIITLYTQAFRRFLRVIVYELCKFVAYSNCLAVGLSMPIPSGFASAPLIKITFFFLASAANMQRK